ncbi:hypothetical protein [Streptomyces avermitilis]|uniref:hypothetical protein n=1 Tax=Streptomyces avermitilis TaxID=33903 RepID=UPI0036A958E3
MLRDDGIDNGRSAHQPFQETTDRQTQRVAELAAPTSDQLISCIWEAQGLPAPAER